MLLNITNTVIILTLSIYELKIEKYTKIFTPATKTVNSITKNPADYSCVAEQVCDGFKQYHRLPVGSICPISREARKSKVGHICPTS